VGGGEPFLLGLIIAISADDWNHLVREECVGSVVVQARRVVFDDELRLYVKIAHHGIAMPPAIHPKSMAMPAQ
jgi:hypothetical protein